MSLIVKLAILEARYLKAPLVDVEHLLLSLFHNREVRQMAFMAPYINAGIDYDGLRRLAMSDAGADAVPEAAGDSDISDDGMATAGARARDARPTRLCSTSSATT